MRHLTGYFTAFLLAILLVGTTPIGTGAGVHQFDLIHPLFAHVHVVNGQVLTHDQIEQRQLADGPSSRGPALGSGSVAGPGDAGLGLSPTLPLQAMRLLPEPLELWWTSEPRLPVGRVDAPPDPPPTPAS